METFKGESHESIMEWSIPVYVEAIRYLNEKAKKIEAERAKRKNKKTLGR